MNIKFILIACMASCSCTIAVAQKEYNLDSLIATIAIVPESKRQDHLYFIRVQLNKLTPEEKINVIDKIITVGEQKLVTPHNRALVYVNVAAMYSWIDSAEVAFKWFQKSIRYAKSLSDTAALAQAHFELSQFQQGNYMYVEALKNALLAKDLVGIQKDSAKYYHYLGVVMKIYSKSNDHINAVKASAEMLRLYRASRTTGNPRDKIAQIMHLYSDIGFTYQNLKQYDSALHYYGLAKQLAIELNDEFWQALSDGNSAVIYMEQQKYDLAIPLLITDFRVSRKYNQMGSAANSATALGDYYISIGQFKTGKAYLDSATYLIEKHKLSTPTSLLNAKAEYEFSQGDYKTAWVTKNKYLSERIEAITRRESTKVLRFQNSYELERKQNEVNDLTKDAEAAQQRLSLQRYILGAGLIIVILLLGWVINIIINYKHQKKINQVIKRHQQETQQAHEELNVAYNNLMLAQQQLIQTEKMALLGRLTAGIAHEVNTPLGVVKASADNIRTGLANIRKNLSQVIYNTPINYTPLILEMIEATSGGSQLSFNQERVLRNKCMHILNERGIADADVLSGYLVDMGISENYDRWIPLLELKNSKKIIQLISETALITAQTENTHLAVTKASKIIFALKSYSHPGSEIADTDLDLIKNIEIVLTIYSSALKQIDMVRDFDDVPLIKGKQDELGQVWTNLLHNALQAIDGVGKLHIAVKKTTENKITIAFTDSGMGISPENQKKLFQPFFTTKAAGEGTGLGLSIVKKIIDNHQGTIVCESTEKQGTTFKVTLPC